MPGTNRAAVQAQRAPSAVAVESAVAAGVPRELAELAARFDLYRTPPWGGRALVRDALPEIAGAVVAEPAAGMGDLAGALGESAARVVESDVVAWRPALAGAVADFLEPGAWEGVLARAGLEAVDFLVTNSPYGPGRPEAFLERALALAAAGRIRQGIALLVRASFREGQGRHALFERARPWAWWGFAERLPMALARFTASTATAYAWVVVRLGPDGRPLAPPGGHPASASFPPGTRAALQRAGDPDVGLKAERGGNGAGWRVAAAGDGSVLFRPAGRGQPRGLDLAQALAEARGLTTTDPALAAELLDAASAACRLAGLGEEGR